MGGAAVSEWVDRLDESAVASADVMLRENGSLHPLTVHPLLEELELPYVGYLTCRPFYRGQDAATAIGVMGVLGSMLGATRLVVTFENADLCTALELPADDGFPAGVVVVDADLRGHTVRWHPVRHTAPGGGPGGLVVIPEWGPVGLHCDVELPTPIAELLAVWRAPRTWPDVELLKAYTGLEVGGYSMRWVQRPPGEQGQPSWMRLLAPVM
jgi:hypothetical protein